MGAPSCLAEDRIVRASWFADDRVVPCREISNACGRVSPQRDFPIHGGAISTCGEVRAPIDHVSFLAFDMVRTC